MLVVLSTVGQLNLRVLLTASSRKASLASVSLSLALLIAFIGTTSSAQLAKRDFAVAASELLSRFDTAACLAYNLVCSAQLSFLCSKLVRPRVAPTIYESLNHQSSNDDLLSKTKVNFGKIVRTAFTHNDEMDPLVRECILILIHRIQ